MGEVIFSADSLVVSRGNFQVSNISFQLKSGDIMGLVGRSGSGKSTVIEALTGVKKPASGSIEAYIDGELQNPKRLIGYSPQTNALYNFLTLDENLKTFGRLHGVSDIEMSERIVFLLKRLDLQNCRHKRIMELSGGMQKRADLAVTLIHSPEIIILDEPFTGLDISLQRFIWGLLKDLASSGCIVIVSSHMLSDTQKNCSQCGLIEKGVFYGTSQIVKALMSTKERSLELFLENLFSKDMEEGS